MNERILVFIPAYNCEAQIGRVLSQLEVEWATRAFAGVVVVNNRSTDRTAEVVAERIRSRGDHYIRLLVNDENYGLGGSHKVAFQYAKQNDFDWVVVLHGDDQGTIGDFRDLIERGEHVPHDAVLGSRFMKGSATPGYSIVRIFANHVFNLTYSICLGRLVRDLGSGLNMYRVSSLRHEQFLRYPDNLTFNCVMLCAEMINNDRVKFSPITWREEDQISNVKAIRQSIQTVGIAASALLNRRDFASAEHRVKQVSSYAWTVVDV